MDSLVNGNKGITAEENVGDSMVKLIQNKKRFLADVEKVKSVHPSLFTPKEITNYTEEELDELLDPFDSIFKTVTSIYKFQTALNQDIVNSNDKPSTSDSNAGEDIIIKENKGFEDLIKLAKNDTHQEVKIEADVEVGSKIANFGQGKRMSNSGDDCQIKIKKEKELCSGTDSNILIQSLPNSDTNNDENEKTQKGKFWNEDNQNLNLNRELKEDAVGFKRRLTRSSFTVKNEKLEVQEQEQAPIKCLDNEKEIFMRSLNLLPDEYDELRDAVKISQSPEDLIMVKPVEIVPNWPILNPEPMPREALEKLKSLALLEYSSFNSEDKKYFGKTPSEFHRMVYGDQIKVLRTNSNKMVQMKEYLKSEHDRDPNLIADDELIITLKFYHSFKFDDNNSASVSDINPERVYLYEIEILGSQTLEDLRKLLRCEYDYICIKSFDYPSEYTDNPDKEQFYTVNNFKNALFCIGNKLYIDPSEEKSKFYAEQIINWSKNSKNIGTMEIGNSSTTLIKDLNLRYGFPYAFIHYGTCEHLMVFTSCRLASAEDLIERKCYPRRIAAGDFRKNVLCMVDNTIRASWLVKDCSYLPLNQMMLCTDCLKTFCYGVWGKKIGKFKLYPIVTPQLF